MITFGYKNQFSSILRTLAAIAIGLVMVISNQATTRVVQIIAVLLFSTGIVSVLYGYLQKYKESRPLFIFNAIVDMALGGVMFYWPDAIGNSIVFIIGILLVLFGALQALVLISTSSILGMGLFSLILASFALFGGIVLIFNPFTTEVMSIIAGTLLIIYGLNELLSIWRVKKATAYFEEVAKQQEDHKTTYTEYDTTIKDVDYEKVSDKTIDEQ